MIHQLCAPAVSSSESQVQVADPLVTWEEKQMLSSMDVTGRPARTLIVFLTVKYTTSLLLLRCLSLAVKNKKRKEKNQESV